MKCSFKVYREKKRMKMKVGFKKKKGKKETCSALRCSMESRAGLWELLRVCCGWLLQLVGHCDQIYAIASDTQEKQR
jgi:hypothetical protein